MEILDLNTLNKNAKKYIDSKFKPIYFFDIIKEIYPPSIINKWIVNKDKKKLYTIDYSCLKRCDEETFYEFYHNEYNPINIKITAIDSKTANLSLSFESIDDAGLTISKYKISLNDADNLVLGLIEMIDSFDVISINDIIEYGNKNNFIINKW